LSAREIEDELRARVDVFNNEGIRPYKLAFSMGFGKFIKGVDDEDSFLQKIDEAMYENKKQRHLDVR